MPKSSVALSIQGVIHSMGKHLEKLTPPEVAVGASWKRHCPYARAADGSSGTALLFTHPEPTSSAELDAALASSAWPAPFPPPGSRAPPWGTPRAPARRGDGLPPALWGRLCVCLVSGALPPAPHHPSFPVGSACLGVWTRPPEWQGPAPRGGRQPCWGTAGPSWLSAAVTRSLSPGDDVESQPRSPQQLLENTES